MNAKLRNIFFTFPIILIFIFFLLLLVYIGYGEANRKSAKFQIGKLVSQATIVKNAFDSFLQAGLPLKQFTGFASLSKNLILSDPKIENIQVRDNHQQLIFFQTQPHFPLKPMHRELLQRIYKPTELDLKETQKKYRVEESDATFKVILPLTRKFGKVGEIIIESKQADIFQIPHEKYQNVFYAYLTISLLFIIFIIIYELIFPNQKTRKAALYVAFISGFLAMSLFIGINLFQIYKQGAQANAKALSNSMAQRLKTVIELGIDFKDLTGINAVFQKYKNNMPEIHAITLTEHGIAHYHTDEKAIGKPYTIPSDNYGYLVSLNETRQLQLVLTIPKKLILNEVLDSLKEFIILFIVISLIAIIFFDYHLKKFIKI